MAHGDGAEHGDGHLQNQQQADEVNLEHARKATELALEHLRDPENRTDRKLLDKLGWTEDDANHFLRRWDEMKRKAGGEGLQAEQAKQELDDVLRGMGLQSKNNKLRKASDFNDKQRNNRNTGRRTKVPANQVDPFRAFQRALQGK